MKTRHHHIFKKNPEYYRVLILRTLGNFLIFGSLFMMAKTLYLPVKEELVYRLDKVRAKEYVVQGSDYDSLPVQKKGLLGGLFDSASVERIVPADTDYGIVIPKIAANARVLPNVNAADENEYLNALNSGVAHAAGTAFPGQQGHIYLFAHSTDYFWNVGSYNAVFYLLYKLEQDDEIDLFYDGQKYVYKVESKKIVDPSEVEYLTRQTSSEVLTLQTCWPPGTTLKRLLVFARRAAE